MTVSLRIAAAGEDVAKLGYAAPPGRARLDEAHGPEVQQATEVQQGRRSPRGDRDAAGAAYLREAVLVFTVPRVTWKWLTCSAGRLPGLGIRG
jgi:hypothetical protein